MTLSYLWYQIVCWVFIAQMITGLLKALVGVCVPRVQSWLLDGFDLSPWKVESKEVPTVNADDTESTSRSNQSLKDRVKNYFSGFSLFKYQLLGAAAHRRSAMFTLNLVVPVILPIKFGLQLARLPLEPCVAACRRKWPPEGKIQEQAQRQTGPVTDIDDNNFDENAGRSRIPRLGSKPPFAETESTIFHTEPSKVIPRPIISERHLPKIDKVSKESLPQENTGTQRHIYQSRPDSSLKDISNKTVREKNRNSKRALNQIPYHLPVDENQLGEKPTERIINTEESISLEQSQFSTEKQPRKRTSYEMHHRTSEEQNHVFFQDYSLPVKTQSVRLFSNEAQFRSPDAEIPKPQPDRLESAGENRCQCKPDVLEQEPRLLETECFSPRPSSSRQLPPADVESSNAELRDSRKECPSSQPDSYQLGTGLNWVEKPSKETHIEVSRRNKHIAHRVSAEKSQIVRGKIGSEVLGDAATQVTDDEVGVIMSQSTDRRAPDQDNIQSMVTRPCSRSSIDDTGRYASSSNPDVPGPEHRRRVGSPNKPSFQGMPSPQTCWRSLHRAKLKQKISPYVLWRNRSAALVHSLDAVESGNFIKQEDRTAKPESQCGSIVFSTADPEEQELMEKFKSRCFEQQEGEKQSSNSDQAVWLSVSLKSSEADFKQAAMPVSLEFESSKKEVSVETQGSARSLGFRTPLQIGSRYAHVPTGLPLVGQRPLPATSEGPMTPLLNGQNSVSSLLPLPSFRPSREEEALLNFPSPLTLMPTVEEENSEADTLVIRRLVRKRSSSGSRRSTENSQENDSCNRAFRRTLCSVARPKAFKMMEKNPSKLSRLVGDGTPRPARRPKSGREGGKSSRKKIEEENVKASTSSTRRDDIPSVLSAFALPSTFSDQGYANACVSTSDDPCVQLAPKLAIKRSNSFPSPHALPDIINSLTKAHSEPNVTSLPHETHDVAEFLRLLKWSKEYYSTNKQVVASPVVSEYVTELPLVEVRSDLVIRRMSEETVVRSQHSHLDYCPACKIHRKDRCRCKLQDKASMLPYELDALIQRPLLENVRALPEPYEPCSVEESIYLRQTTKPPLKPEVNVEAVLGEDFVPEPTLRRSHGHSSNYTPPHRSSSHTSSSTRPPFSQLPPVPCPRSSNSLPPCPNAPRPSPSLLRLSPHSPPPSADSQQPPLLPYVNAPSRFNHIESDFLDPWLIMMKERYNRSFQKFYNESEPAITPIWPLEDSSDFYPGYRPEYIHHQNWGPDQQCHPSFMHSSYPRSRTFTREIGSNQHYAFSSGNASNLFHRVPSVRSCTSRPGMWGGIDPSTHYSSEVLTSTDHKFKPNTSQETCSSQTNAPYWNVKQFERAANTPIASISAITPSPLLSPQSSVTFSNPTQPQNVFSPPLPPNPPSCPFIPGVYADAKMGLPTVSRSLNQLQYANPHPPFGFVHPAGILASLEIATKRANDLLSKSPPVPVNNPSNIITASNQESTKTNHLTISSRETKPTTIQVSETRRTEFPITTPIICMSSREDTTIKRPDLTGGNLNCKKLATPDTAVKRIEPPLHSMKLINQDLCTKATEFPLVTTSTPIATEINKSECAPQGRESDTITTADTATTIVRVPLNSAGPQHISDSEVGVVPTQTVTAPTERRTDFDSFKGLVSNYKEIHRQEMLLMHENFNLRRSSRKMDPDARSSIINDSGYTDRTFSEPCCDSDSKLLPMSSLKTMNRVSSSGNMEPSSHMCPAIPMNSPRISEQNFRNSEPVLVETLTSTKERSHKNLSSLLEKELNFKLPHSSGRKTSSRVRLRKRMARVLTPSQLDKPSRKTRRLKVEDETERERHCEPTLTRLKVDLLNVKVFPSQKNSFSYFAVKKIHSTSRAASSSSNSDCCKIGHCFLPPYEG